MFELKSKHQAVFYDKRLLLCVIDLLLITTSEKLVLLKSHLKQRENSTKYIVFNWNFFPQNEREKKITFMTKQLVKKTLLHTTYSMDCQKRRIAKYDNFDGPSCTSKAVYTF